MEGGIRQEQRTTNAKRRNTNYRIGAEGANGEMENDVMDLISEVHLKLSVQLASRVRDVEAATHCTLFQLRCSAIVKEMRSAGRAYDELINTRPSVERGSPHIWFVTAMLRRQSKASSRLGQSVRGGSWGLASPIHAVGGCTGHAGRQTSQTEVAHAGTNQGRSKTL